jgi:hypothetical protein
MRRKVVGNAALEPSRRKNRLETFEPPQTMLEKTNNGPSRRITPVVVLLPDHSGRLLQQTSSRRQQNFTQRATLLSITIN